MNSETKTWLTLVNAPLEFRTAAEKRMAREHKAKAKRKARVMARRPARRHTSPRSKPAR